MKHKSVLLMALLTALLGPAAHAMDAAKAQSTGLPRCLRNCFLPSAVPGLARLPFYALLAGEAAGASSWRPGLLRLRGAGRPNGRQAGQSDGAAQALGAAGLGADDSSSDGEEDTESTTASGMQVRPVSGTPHRRAKSCRASPPRVSLAPSMFGSDIVAVHQPDQTL